MRVVIKRLVDQMLTSHRELNSLAQLRTHWDNLEVLS